MAFMLFIPQTKAADICNANNINTQYKAIYCDIQQDDSEDFDDDLIEILANQFGLSEDTIKEILGGTICDSFNKLTKDEQVKMPQAIQDACLPSGKSTEQVLGGWSVFSDIKNTYEKEKVIQQSSKALTYKFKVSEQYWDGQIGPGPDAPFDLIVDLNLIEIVLFGSKATWMSDVFTFPTDEEDEGNGGETPLDELLPEDTPSEETTTPEDTGDPGLTVTEEGGGEALPPDCVLPDDPEADNGNGPGSDYENPLCGNGTIELLLAEQCDDGNTDSGDGCNQYCQTEATGSNDQCIDPDAVTFKKPEDKKGSGSSQTGGAGSTDGNASGNQNGSECPEGTVPRIGSGISGQEAGPPKEIPQNPEYPGPFLGGTLKQFPESNRPLCGPGESPVQITIAGETKMATNDDGSAKCIRTEFCKDFKEAQDFLFGDGWEDDDTLVNIAPSIEALFCVNIIKENRPLSPYNLNEGCVDCHIIAMVDALEKALQTNVTPLKNTTNAFGISSPYGPNFSFNLNTATKTKLKFNNTGTAANAIKKAEESYAEIRKKSSPVKFTDSPLANLKNSAIQDQKNTEDILENIRLSGLSNAVISDQEVGGRIRPLLEQMKESFSRIQSTYEAIIGSTALDKKEPCK